MSKTRNENATLICRNLSYECQIGFHGFEQKIKQVITIDLWMTVQPLETDNVKELWENSVDYYKLNEFIKEHVSNQSFNLIETIAKQVSALILAKFPVKAIKIRVTKRPQDMPNAGSVSYEYTIQNNTP